MTDDPIRDDEDEEGAVNLGDEEPGDDELEDDELEDNDPPYVEEGDDQGY